MSAALLFWVIMLIWLIFGLFSYWPAASAKAIHENREAGKTERARQNDS